MQDTFWTDELVKEYASLYIKESWEQLGELKKNITSVEQFKSSKSPKKEWEIVAYRVRDKNVYYPEYTDDIGRIWGNAEWKGAFIDSADVNHPDVKIFSVRRLSDGEVFSVGDRIKTETYPNCVIESFSINNNTLAIQHTKNTLFVTWGNVDYFNKISKLPQPILTVDGVEIFPGDKFWVIINWEVDPISPHEAKESGRGWWKDARVAAKAYILNNKHLLSLNDVKEYLGVTIDNSLIYSTDLEELAALVKQKLNQ